MGFAAKYYDGRQASSLDAEVILENDRLAIGLTDVILYWDYASVQMPGKPEFRRPVIITYATTPEARLVVADNALYDLLVKKIPRGNAPLFSISASLGSIISWGLLAVVMLILLYLVVPDSSVTVAKYIPPSWNKALGEYVVDIITDGKGACSNPAGVNALGKLTGALVSRSDAHPQVTVEVVENPMVNAFAAPGGRIVIFNSLLKEATDQYELSGVIAHEMGHVIRNHPTQHAVRGLWLNLAINMIFSGTGSTGTTAAAANEIVQLRFSRTAESEADSIAAGILYNAGMNNQGLINFFERLKVKEEKKGTPDFSYVSTHPPTSERITALKGAKTIRQSRPILTDSEWQALKHICK